MIADRAAGFGLGLFAAIDFAVIATPGFILAGAAEKGGLAGAHGLDLVAASVVLGTAHAAYVWTRLRRELRPRTRAIDVLIANLNSTVVLALASTLLLMAVLGGFAPQHATLVNRGWPVVALWIGVQMAAVALAELTRIQVRGWLDPGGNDPPGCR